MTEIIALSQKGLSQLATCSRILAFRAANDSASQTTTVIAETDLSIAKADSPDPVVAGTNLTYTVTVTNNGPSDSTGSAVTDVLPAGLSFVSSGDGCAEGPVGTVT